MNRFVLSCFLLVAVGAASQPASSGPAPPGQTVSSPSASGSNSASQKPRGQSSPEQPSPEQASPQQQAPNQPGAANSPSKQNSSAQGSSAQNEPAQSPSAQQPNDEGEDAQESSSRDTRTDISPPKDDAKEHPDSKQAVSDLVPAPPADTSDVLEFHPWNPMKALKDIEVGDYYFKRKNYKAALDRYKEALYYKENDAVATYLTAVCEEKLGDKPEARKNFEQYLKILPEGPFAKDARAALEKLGGKGN